MEVPNGTVTTVAAAEVEAVEAEEEAAVEEAEEEAAVAVAEEGEADGAEEEGVPVPLRSKNNRRK